MSRRALQFAAFAAIVGTSIVGSNGCVHPELSGSGLLVNMQPPPPLFAGAYDFDLLDQVQGKGCANRASLGQPGGVQFWVSGALAKVSSDPLTALAINAAAFDAIKTEIDADSIVVTRVISEGHGPDRICAVVYGRAIRLTKAVEHVQVRQDPPAAKHTDTDLDEK